MSESSMRKRLVQSLKVFDAVPIENKLTKGTPDVEFIGGWMELKWIKKWPTNANKSPVLLPHYTPNQRLWLRRRGRRGGVALLVLQVGQEWFVFDHEYAATHVGKTAMRQDLRENAIAHWSRGLKNKELIKCLRSLINTSLTEKWSISVESDPEKPNWSSQGN